MPTLGWELSFCLVREILVQMNERSICDAADARTVSTDSIRYGLLVVENIHSRVQRVATLGEKRNGAASSPDRYDVAGRPQLKLFLMPQSPATARAAIF